MKCKKWFSSPFIEERLYLELEMEIEEMYRIVLVPFYRGAVVFQVKTKMLNLKQCSRPLLSRSGCIYYGIGFYACGYNGFSSPFIEERLYLSDKKNKHLQIVVLVPFYRGAVVFFFLSFTYTIVERVLVPFYRGAVVFREL